MISRWNPTSNDHAVSRLTASTATPRPRAAEFTQYPISASPVCKLHGVERHPAQELVGERYNRPVGSDFSLPVLGVIIDECFRFLVSGDRSRMPELGWPGLGRPLGGVDCPRSAMDVELSLRSRLNGGWGLLPIDPEAITGDTVLGMSKVSHRALTAELRHSAGEISRCCASVSYLDNQDGSDSVSSP
jgi:hypothetical protein